MTEYIPHRWMIIKIDRPNDPHYRVFGSWFGGYLHGDSWRMNSGITKIEKDGDEILFHGATGSVYRCHKDSYGANSYGYSVIESMVKDHPDTIKPLYEKPDLETLL